MARGSEMPSSNTPASLDETSQKILKNYAGGITNLIVGFAGTHPCLWPQGKMSDCLWVGQTKPHMNQIKHLWRKPRDPLSYLAGFFRRPQTQVVCLSLPNIQPVLSSGCSDSWSSPSLQILHLAASISTFLECWPHAIKKNPSVHQWSPTFSLLCPQQKGITWLIIK